MDAALEVLNELDALVTRRSILQHPFYRAWTGGLLTRTELQVYARTYYPHVAAFPEYIRTALRNIEGGRTGLAAAVRETLSENLREELSEPLPHAELWLRFAEAAGVDRIDVMQTKKSPGAQETVNEFQNLAASGMGPALAALYAYECQQPAVAVEKMRGLQKYYGISDAAALSYFRVHAEADIRHSGDERRGLESCLRAGVATRDELLGSAGRALAAYWNLLDAVCAERPNPLD